MITRRIPTQRGVGPLTAVRRLRQYLEGLDESRGLWRLSNFRATDKAAAEIEYVVTQARNERATSERNYHLVVSFDSRDRSKLTRERLREIEDELVAGIGLGEHQRLSIVHEDTANTHIHVMVNLIHPRTHRIKVPWRDKSKLSNLCADIQERYGLVRTDQGLGPKGPKLGRAREAERRSGERSFAGWVSEEIDVQKCRSWRELHAQCAARGVRIESRGRGLVLAGRSKDGELYAVACHRALGGRRALEYRLGEFRPATGEPRVPCGYERGPLHESAKSHRLYAEYRVNAAHLARQREVRLRDARRRRELAVRQLTVVEDRALMDVRERREVVNRVRLEFGALSRRIVHETPRRTWLQYLQVEAARGRPGASVELARYTWQSERPARVVVEMPHVKQKAASGGAGGKRRRRRGVEGRAARRADAIAVRLPVEGAWVPGPRKDKLSRDALRILQKRSVEGHRAGLDVLLPGAIRGDVDARARERDNGLRRGAPGRGRRGLDRL